MTKDNEKEKRLAEALRANLQRRKAQGRERSSSETDEGPKFRERELTPKIKHETE